MYFIQEVMESENNRPADKPRTNIKKLKSMRKEKRQLTDKITRIQKQFIAVNFEKEAIKT